MYKFSERELEFFQKKGIEVSKVQSQIELIIKGQKYVKVIRSADLQKGIHKIENLDEYFDLFEDARINGKIIKFVPASGAASRMFQSLAYTLNNFRNFNKDELLSCEDKQVRSSIAFIQNINETAMYYELLSYCQIIDINLEKLIEQKEYIKIIDLLLSEEHLNYLNKPKCLIPFHRFDERNFNPLYEQIAESLDLTCSSSYESKIHFTISAEHDKIVKEELNRIIGKITSYDIDVSISYQNESTNTISLDSNNMLVLSEDKNPLLRQAGHGALLSNLESLDEDFIHIKNIDNILPFSKAEENLKFSKYLIGKLISLTNQLHSYQKQYIDNTADLVELSNFLKKEFFIELNQDLTDIKEIIFRPIRVCAMVRNEGEPGGGPFFIDNVASPLQIIELNQIDISNKEQFDIFSNSKFFNPVEIAASIKDFTGNKYELNQFVDYSMSQIVKKSYKGKEINCLELPGLWNGTMAGWLTTFVEFPISTFNPVKTVMDLLRENHKVIIS